MRRAPILAVRVVLTAAFMALALVPASRAQSDEADTINADRPGIADGSTTVRRGAWQLEVGLERDHQLQDGVDDHLLSTPILLRYGLDEKLELRVEGSGYERETTRAASGTDHADGFAPLSIGFKYHFLEENQKTHQPSLGFIARLFVPSGSGEFRSHDASADVRLAADLDLNDRWALNPNIGIAYSGDGDSFTAALAALTVQYNVAKKANLFVDAGFKSPEEKGGTSSLILDAGGALIIGNDLQLDASIGWAAHGRTVPNVFLSAGISRRF